MIDRVVLEQVAARHLGSMRSPSGVLLLAHLHGRALHGSRLRRIPRCPLNDEMPRDPAGASIFDRLVLPYEAISYLTLTAREPENRSTIGFQTQWTAKKQS